MNKEHIKALKLLDNYFKETPKDIIKKEIDLISDLNAQSFALTLTDVVKSEKFVCDKHPNARTYTSTTGRHFCVKCVMG